MTLTTPARDLQTGDEFVVVAALHANESLNALEGTVRFSNDVAELVAFQSGDSVFPLWIGYPASSNLAAVNQDGTFDLAATVPGGVAGLNGDEAFALLFRAKQAGSFRVALEDARVFVNDGAGTGEPLSAAPLVTTVASATREPVTVTQADSVPPVPFALVRARDSSVADGKWFVGFTTRDAGSGLDRYEIAECRSCAPEDLAWQEAKSPAILADQSLRSTVYVRAIDRAGNVRLATLPPAPYEGRPWTWAVLAAILALAAAGLYFKAKAPPRRPSSNR